MLLPYTFLPSQLESDLSQLNSNPFVETAAAALKVVSVLENWIGSRDAVFCCCSKNTWLNSRRGAFDKLRKFASVFRRTTKDERTPGICSSWKLNSLLDYVLWN